MKVVINKSTGGFGLSFQAIEEYCRKKEKNLYYYVEEIGPPNEYFKTEFPEKYFLNHVHFSTKDYGDWTFRIEKKHRINIKKIDRTDPDLINIIEKMGETANSKYSKLKIVEIPDNVNWRISEYDGQEKIREVARIWE